MTPFKPSDLPPRLQAQLYAHTLASGLSNTLPEQDARLSPLGTHQDEKGSSGRIGVRITRKGTKLLDLDNLYGSVKFLCDALRYEKIIPEDNPQAITLEVRQEKVGRTETGTLIEIVKDS